MIYGLVRAEVELGICVSPAFQPENRARVYPKPWGLSRAVKGCHEEILAFHFAISAIHALARGVGDGVEYIHRATLQRIDVN